MTVLVWGMPTDTTTASVLRALRRMGTATVVLDQRQVLATSVCLEVGQDAARPLTGAWADVNGHRTDLTTVGAAYVRPYESIRVPAVRREAAGSAAWRHAQEIDDCLVSWTELTDAFVVSRLSAGASNGSKPAQSMTVAACGFALPETVVTNDPEVAAEFVARHGDVVCKSTSGVRSIVRRVDPRAPLDDVRVCPTQFQQRVDGVDVRVHVVGREVFATEIHCDADDYRYASRQGRAPARLSAGQLPREVARRCCGLAERLSLPVAGVDLRVTPDGEWFCFEVNPSPAFSYYEDGTGQPIAAAVAGLLTARTICRPAPVAAGTGGGRA